MSREIKFRAWNDGEGMINHELLSLSFTGKVLVDRGSSGVQQLDIPLMQYTGLKDVFESDIIRDHIGIGLVEYVDDKAAFRVNYKNGIAKWFIDYNLKGELESIEVIGNIYKNPELLENNHE